MTASRPVSPRIDRIFKDFYKDAAVERYLLLVKMAQEFVGQLDILSGCNVYISDLKILKAVDSYFLDVIRYKEYHFQTEMGDAASRTESEKSERENAFYGKEWAHKVHVGKLINDSKVAAFLAKWLLKASPIYIVPDDSEKLSEDQKSVLICANELFALTCALYALRIDIKDISPEDIDDILYNFRFRAFDERAYFTKFDLMKRIYPSHAAAVPPTDSPANENGATVNSAPTECDAGRMEGTKVNEEGKLKLAPSSSTETQYKVFVASPSDVSELRQATQELFDKLNAPFIARGVVKFVPFFWEEHKVPEHLDNASQYQQNIFKEFGDHCDIFILLLWNKFGEGTIKEYEHFNNVFKQKNPDVRFWMCRYVKPVPPHTQDHSSAEALQKWLANNEGNWAPIGAKKNFIKSKKVYIEALERQLLTLLAK